MSALEKLQFSKVARPFEDELMWRAVDLSSPKDPQPFRIAFERLVISQIRDFSNGAFGVSFVLRDVDKFKTLLTIEQKAKDKLTWLQKCNDGNVRGILDNDDDDPSDVFFSKLVQTDFNTLVWTVGDQFGSRDSAAYRVGQKVDVALTLIGITTRNGRGFQLRYEIERISKSYQNAESVEDEFGIPEASLGPDPEEVAEMKRELAQKASKLILEYDERKGLVESILEKLPDAGLDEIERLATELSLNCDL